MNIAITGATGLIGRELVRKLLRGGHRVEAWTRDPASAAEVLPANCQITKWDPAEVDPVALRDTDAVIHLAGENVAGARWTAHRKNELVRSRVESSRSLVEAIATLPEQQRPHTLLSASAIGYYGDRGDETLAETAAAGTGFLPDLCAHWEKRILSAEDLGVRAAVLRIGIVLSREGGMLGTVLPVFRAGLGGRLGSGRQWMSWIHLDDVVRLFLHTLENDEVHGPVNATAPMPVRNQVFTRALATSVGRPAILPVPSLGLRLAFGEMASVMTSSQRVVPLAAEESGFRFQHPTLGDALAEICSSDHHELVFEQRVEQPIDEAFRFFSDPRNLEKITPPFLNFRITSLPEGDVQEGSHIEYRLRVHGVPVAWRTRIEEWHPPYRFVDVQEKGPYALWHHTHELESSGAGTVVRDRIRYRLPLGGIGDIVAGAWVAKDLREIFRYRRAQIAHYLAPSRKAA